MDEKAGELVISLRTNLKLSSESRGEELCYIGVHGTGIQENNIF